MSKKSISRVNTLLRKERLLQGWSQQDLADRLGITIVTVNRWERGVQQPSPMFRLKLCMLFDKREEELGLWSKETDVDPVSPATLEQSELPRDFPNTEACEAQQQQERPPLHTFPVDVPSLPVCPSTPFASTSVVSSSQLSRCSHTISPPVEAMHASYTAFAHKKQIFLLRPLSLKFFLLLLIVFVFLLSTSAIIFLRWFFPYAQPQASIPTHRTRTALSGGLLSSSSLLYEAHWSQGNDKWILSGHSAWSDNIGGEIKTDGGNSNDVLVAPYALHLADYAIEASIKRAGYTHLGGDAYGLMVRNDPRVGGYIAGLGAHFPPEHVFIGMLLRSGDNGSEYVSADLIRAPSHLDTRWHIYRLEVRGSTLTFFLDGTYIAQGESNIYTQAGNAGIYIDSARIEIRSFKIEALV